MAERVTTEPETIGQAIREARKGHGWTQAQLARRLQVTEKQINNWESGRHEPSFSMFARISLLFEWVLPYSAEWSTPEKRTRAVRVMTAATIVLARLGG